MSFFQGHEHEVKCLYLCLGFELMSSILFPATIIIMQRVPKCVYMHERESVCVCDRSKPKKADHSKFFSWAIYLNDQRESNFLSWNFLISFFLWVSKWNQHLLIWLHQQLFLKPFLNWCSEVLQHINELISKVLWPMKSYCAHMLTGKSVNLKKIQVSFIGHFYFFLIQVLISIRSEYI